MHRRALLAASAAFAAVRPVAASVSVSEVRVGAGPGLARRMQRGLGVAVRAVGTGLVERLDAGHLEMALLTSAELAAARHRMGDRLMELGGTVDGLIPVTRRVLPPSLRAALQAALA